MQSAWKVGLFVLLFAALVAVAYSLVGHSLFRPRTITYFADFASAEGIQEGAVVTMAGVRVGTVQSVSLNAPNRARMAFALNAGTFVPADAMAVIPTSLLSIGEQRVEIQSKSGAAAGRLPPGSVMPGMKASFLQAYFPEGEKTIDVLNSNLEALRDILGDEGIKGRIDQVIASTERTIYEAGLLMADARGLIVENRGALRKAIVSAAAAVDDLRRGIAEVNAIVSDPQLRPQIQGILDSLARTAEQAERLAADLSSFVGDPKLRGSLESTVSNMEQISETGTRIAANAEQITTDGAVISKKAIELADSAQEIAAEAKRLLAKVSDFVDRLPQDVKLPIPRFSIETGRNVKANVFQTDFSVVYPLNPSVTLYGGVYDATESNRLSLQYGNNFGPILLRYGIFASKPGVGVDWEPFTGLGLSGDLFNPNDPQFNVRGRIGLGREWFGYIGVNSLFDRNELLIGLGARR